jgi:hypothetical protein
MTHQASIGNGGAGGNDLVPDVPDVILPILEVDADADTLVCQMTGTGNEAAAGVLTGIDLVLTMNGAVGAAVDGFRQISVGGMGFLVTPAFFNAFFVGDQYTIMHRVKDMNLTGNGYLMYLASGSTTAPNIVNIGYNIYGGTPEVSEAAPGGAGPFFRTTAPMLNDASTDGWLFRSRNKNVFVAGFKQGDEPPRNMFDSTFGYGSVRYASAPTYSAIGSFGTYNAIVGINSIFNNPAAWKQGTVVVSQKALGVPAEWLV